MAITTLFVHLNQLHLFSGVNAAENTVLVTWA
ncbi:Uncharacterised protein [Vibrio cholerae]|nr:Uncharacterised protein [Vibrio cholerae]